MERLIRQMRRFHAYEADDVTEDHESQILIKVPKIMF